MDLTPPFHVHFPVLTSYWIWHDCIKVSIGHLQRVWHANRGRLLLRTPGPVPYGIEYFLLVETNPFPNLSLFYRTMLFEYLSVLSRFCLLTFLTFYLIVQGFHRTYATGAACQQRTLTPPDTWSCPTLGLACVLMSRPISPELVLSPDFWNSNTPRYFSFPLNHDKKSTS